MTALRMRVARAELLTPEIRSIVLVDAEGARLPDHAPGSHVVLEAGPVRNAYSLVGAGIAPREYAVSVRRRPDGRGGSAWLHDVLAVGDELVVHGPVSAFAPVLTGRKSLLVAAGIGVTPILSHLRAALAWGRDVQVVYGYRPGAAAHLGELRELAGARLVEATGREELAAVLGEVVVGQPWGTHAYACGPPGVLELVARTARDAGWPGSRVHVERFQAADADPGAPFEAVLVRTGRRVRVPSGTSLLEAVLDAGAALPHMCRQGVCGQCLVGVVSGGVQHRDSVLDEDERAAGDCMLACVSRAAGAAVEIDL